MSLLNDLRGVGEQLLDAELPAGREIVPILGALVAHLESKGEQLATVELDKLAGKLRPPEPPPAGAPPPEAAAGPIATEAAPAGETPVERVARLEAELTQARATAPSVIVSTEPPPA